MSRRAIIRLAVSATAGAALGGCARSGDDTGDGRPLTRSEAAVGADGNDAASSADVTLVQGAIAGEQSLVDLCRAAIHEQPRLRAELAPIAVIAGRHVRTLQQAAEAADPPPAQVEALPRTILAVRATVQQQLRSEQRDRATECLAAESGALAQLLGSMSASHAMSAAALAAARRGR